MNSWYPPYGFGHPHLPAHTHPHQHTHTYPHPPAHAYPHPPTHAYPHPPANVYQHHTPSYHGPCHCLHPYHPPAYPQPLASVVHTHPPFGQGQHWDRHHAQASYQAGNQEQTVEQARHGAPNDSSRLNTDTNTRSPYEIS